ncbi:hypothetical protein JB92DRAFT_2206098 [Gautieria morchelliformis]|nr:hypothetical protein JB92DRAFT_2206098 [Gautieria morchelliformis]
MASSPCITLHCLRPFRRRDFTCSQRRVELLQNTQAYFERQTTTLPYLRLYQSIVTNDLTDIIQNADLREWQEIFVGIGGKSSNYF